MRDIVVSDFSGRAGKDFEVEAGDRRLTLTLDRFEELPGGTRSGGSFRLEFVGPLEPVLPQSTYSFEESGERFEIFIVPVGQEPAGIRYEAIFF